jgi:hypothetical protein
MPARGGDVTLGIGQVIVPDREGSFVEVRIEADELDHVARLGATAILTVIFEGGEGPEAAPSVVKIPVSFTRGGSPVRRFAIEGRSVRPAGP